MLFLNLLVKVLYSLSTLALVIYAAVLSFGGQGFVPTFHALGPYFPVISSFFVIGFQFELLKKILARKELSLRATGVSDAAVDKLLGMQSLQSLTFKENGSVTAEGLKKLASRKWSKLDVGASADAGESAAQ